MKEQMKEQPKRIDFDDENRLPAEEYEALAQKFIPGCDGLYSLALTFLSLYLPERADVLIVGAGGGKELATFGRAFPQANFTGVDPSEKMLAVAREKVEKENLESRVSLVRGTIDDVEAKEFDAATALLAMHFLPDDGEKSDFLQAIHRRLKPGAKLVLADGCVDKNSAEFELLRQIYRRHALLKGAPPEIVEEAARAVTEDVHCVSEKRQSELFAEAGFGAIQPFFQGLWFRGWFAAKL